VRSTAATPGVAAPETLDQTFWGRASTYHLWYSVLGLIVGAVCVLSGVVLFLHGVAGNTSWTASLLGLNSKITDAAPGVVFAILGFFVIYVTRYDVRVEPGTKAP
jgi:hypothetical protein